MNDKSQPENGSSQLFQLFPHDLSLENLGLENFYSRGHLESDNIMQNCQKKNRKSCRPAAWSFILFQPGNIYFIPCRDIKQGQQFVDVWPILSA